MSFLLIWKIEPDIRAVFAYGYESNGQTACTKKQLVPTRILNTAQSEK